MKSCHDCVWATVAPGNKYWGRMEYMSPHGSLSPSIDTPPSPPSTTRSEPTQFRFHGSELSIIPRMLWSYLYFLPLPDLQWEIPKWIVSYVSFVPNVLSSIKDYPHLTKVLLYQVILLLMFLFSQSLWLFFIEIVPSPHTSFHPEES